jgi:hypothetical protein
MNLGFGIAASEKPSGRWPMPYPLSSVKNVTLYVVFRLNLERFHPIYPSGGYIAVV